MTLHHTPCQILAQHLIDAAFGAVPATGVVWPITYSLLSDAGDNAIVVYDNAGRMDGRIHDTGESIEHPGVMVRVRAGTQNVAGLRIRQIADRLDIIKGAQVAIEGKSYTIDAVTRGPVISLGQEEGRHRFHFTVNAVATIREN